jgi:selenium-binding protein 1
VSDAHETNHESRACCGPGYASPEEAMKAEREKVLYTVALYVGTEVEQPDYLASVDVDPESPTYSRVVERTPMPNVGDELHHFGWNACSSCHDNESKSRRFLVVPGERSGRIHIIDTQDERAPKMHKVIEPEANRPGLVRRSAGEDPGGRGSQAGGRPTDAAALARRQATLRDQLAL